MKTIPLLVCIATAALLHTSCNGYSVAGTENPAVQRMSPLGDLQSKKADLKLRKARIDRLRSEAKRAEDPSRELLLVDLETEVWKAQLLEQEIAALESATLRRR